MPALWSIVGFFFLSLDAAAFFFKSAEYRLYDDPISVKQVRDIFDNASELSDAELEIRLARYYENKKLPNTTGPNTFLELNAIFELNQQAENAWDAFLACNDTVAKAAKAYRSENESVLKSRCPNFQTITIRQNLRNFVSTTNFSIAFRNSGLKLNLHPFFLQIVFEELNKELYPLSKHVCDPKNSSSSAKNCGYISLVASDVFKTKNPYYDNSQLIEKYKNEPNYKALFQIISLWSLSNTLIEASSCDQLGLWPGISAFMIEYSMKQSWFVQSIDTTLNYISEYKYYRSQNPNAEKKCVSNSEFLRKPYTQAASQWLKEIADLR